MLALEEVYITQYKEQVKLTSKKQCYSTIMFHHYHQCILVCVCQSCFHTCSGMASHECTCTCEYYCFLLALLPLLCYSYMYIMVTSMHWPSKLSIVSCRTHSVSTVPSGMSCVVHNQIVYRDRHIRPKCERCIWELNAVNLHSNMAMQGKYMYNYSNLMDTSNMIFFTVYSLNTHAIDMPLHLTSLSMYICS